MICYIYISYNHVLFFFVFSLNRANFTFFLLESFLLESVLAESTGGSPGHQVAVSGASSVLGALDSNKKITKWSEGRIDETSRRFNAAQNGSVSSHTYDRASVSSEWNAVFTSSPSLLLELDTWLCWTVCRCCATRAFRAARESKPDCLGRLVSLDSTFASSSEIYTFVFGGLELLTKAIQAGKTQSR